MPMYRFSRSMYLALRDLVVAPDEARRASLRRILLQRCEDAVERLALDPNRPARPALRLFNDVRAFFPLAVQIEVHDLIDRHLREALAYIQTADGEQEVLELARCRASTRRGKACQRLPLPGSRYCPSHKHLERPGRFAA